MRKLIAAQAIVLLFASACGAIGTRHPVEFGSDSYTLQGKNYSFAIYDSTGRLLTEPISRFRSQWDNRSDMNQLCKIAKKQRADEQINSCKEPGSSRQISDIYVISHGWNYAVREAIANYHIYMKLIDQQLPQVRRIDPNFEPYFIFVIWPSVARPITDMASAVFPFRLDEALQPVTSTVDGALFFTLTGWKESLNAFTVAIGKKYPVEYEQGTDQRCDPLTEGVKSEYVVQTNASQSIGRDCPVASVLYQLLELNKGAKVHLVGHSYGAKVVSLAGIEALRRAVATKLVPTDSIDTAIQSLVMLNPAMHPREFLYRLKDATGQEPQIVNATELLGYIPRKALVYSDKDYATGFLFDFSQLLMNNELNQQSYQVSHNLRFPGEDKNIWGLRDLYKIAAGAAQLGESVVVGSLTYGVRFLTNLPYDFWYHLKHNDTFTEEEWGPVKYLLNAGHFFFPLDHIMKGDSQDQMGLFRFSAPALGSVGLDKLGRGREVRLNWGPLEQFVDVTGNTTDRSRSDFCRMASNFEVKLDFQVSPERIYSFDATDIYNTRLINVDGSETTEWKDFDFSVSPAGAHGDLRSDETVSCIYAIESPPIKQPKRVFTFNFVYNFTKRSEVAKKASESPARGK